MAEWTKEIDQYRPCHRADTYKRIFKFLICISEQQIDAFLRCWRFLR